MADHRAQVWMELATRRPMVGELEELPFIRVSDPGPRGLKIGLGHKSLTNSSHQPITTTVTTATPHVDASGMLAVDPGIRIWLNI